MADVYSRLLPLVEAWYELNGDGASGDRVTTNTIAAGLHLSALLGANWPFTPDVYQAASQVKGLSGATIRAYLSQHGETRRFTSEGGRTSRGTIVKASRLADIFTTFDAPSLGSLSDVERADLSWKLQAWFVEKFKVDYFDKQRLDPELVVDATVARNIEAILQESKLRGGHVAGAVAQHLVGAKLALRFPGHPIGRESYSTADQQTGRAGDFQVGDSAFHVTMAPTEKLMSERCAANLRDALRPVVVVPAERLIAAQQLADNAGLLERVSVIALEVFVGLNVEEMATFSSNGIRSGLRELLEAYNERIEAVEPDQSLKIEIPANL